MNDKNNQLNRAELIAKADELVLAEKVYVIAGDGRIIRGSVSSASLLTWGVYLHIVHDGLDDMPGFDPFVIQSEEIGNIAFRTQEEAEAKRNMERSKSHE